MNRRLLLILLPAALVFAGCGEPSAEPLLPATIELPASWVADGKTWSAQAELTKPDEDVLTKFFQLQPAFQGSSDFEGVPKLMTSGTSDRRFFWLRGSGETIVWSCVHFEGGKFRTSDGTGNPFLK